MVSDTETLEAPAILPGETRRTEEATCLLCGSEHTEEFLRLEGVPVLCNVTYDNPQQARAAPRGDIHLCHCPHCRYVFNRRFDPGIVGYDPHYENAQHYSPRFCEYIQDLVTWLVDTCGIREKQVVEIGCGDGYFLRMLCEQGDNRGVGYDPSYRTREKEELTSEQCRIVPMYYGADRAARGADLYCFRHVLEHLPHPLGFLQQLRRDIGTHRTARVYCEVPNAERVLWGEGMWDILYEHHSYFVGSSIRRIFCQAGFKPVRIWSAFRGDFLCVLARPGEETNISDEPAFPGLSHPMSVRDLDARMRSRIARFVLTIQQWRRARREIVFWGAGSRGVMLLNLLGDAGKAIHRIVDINERKQGRYLAGTGQKIVSPESLCKHPPEGVEVVNPVYRREVARTLGKMNISAEVLSV